MPERERGHVEQEDVLDLAGQDRTLDRGTDRHDLVRIDALVRLLAEELLHRLDDLGHPGHAADQDHLVDVAGLEARVLQRLLAGLDRLLDQVLDQLLQLGAADLHGQMLRARGIGRDERQIDLGLHRRGQLDLGLLGRLLEALQRQAVVPQIDPVLLLELVGHVVDQALVEVLAAEERVAVGRLHLEHAVADLEDRHVERAAAEVVDRDRLVLALVHAVGEGGRGRLVDDPDHVEAGDLAGVLGRLALAVVEVGRDGDHRLLDRHAEIALGGRLHLLQNLGADLRRRLLLVAHLHPGVAIVGADDLVGHHVHVLADDRVLEAPTDQALDREQRVLGVGYGLPLRRHADQHLAVLGVGHHRGGRAHPLLVLDHAGVLALHDGDAAVRRAEIDSDDLAHSILSRETRNTSSRGGRSRRGELDPAAGSEAPSVSGI